MIGGLSFISQCLWIDGKPFWASVEPYRKRLFESAFERDIEGRMTFNLILAGRAKKNWKTTDLVMAALGAMMDESPGGSECYLLCNDLDQAADDLSLAKKIVAANPAVALRLLIQENEITRKDGRGFLRILPAMDVKGQHGKTYRLAAFDEIHAYRNWDLLEAMALDPSRPDAQQFITSYASLHHKPGVPLFDLIALGKAGSDPRMKFSWYGGDFTTDPDFADATPEKRANPSMESWFSRTTYLAQQQRRLPAHKYRRLHLNLPGLPEGSAFQVEPIAMSIERGVMRRPRIHGQDLVYAAFCDMSGGSSDDATLAIAHKSHEGRLILDCVINQGQPCPFNPRDAVKRFVAVLQDYGIGSVWGDQYAGQTFRQDFAEQSITYHVSVKSRSELYETLEPNLNAHRCVLLDVPEMEQQLLGLVWRGGKIDHPTGEHDDFANAVAGVLSVLDVPTSRPFFCPELPPESYTEEERAQWVEASPVEQCLLAHGSYFPGDTPGDLREPASVGEQARKAWYGIARGGRMFWE